jgi:predicted nucleic acid-binding protein
LIHLDTGFLIRALVIDSPQDRRLRGWLVADETIGISAIAWAEFLCEPVDRQQADAALQVVNEPEAFGAEHAELAARLFNEGGRRRGTFADCMIAATALRAGASLATTDPADFRRFASAGLRLQTA